MQRRTDEELLQETTAAQQHVSDLEKALEQARKERDEALARLKPSGQVAEDAIELMKAGAERITALGQALQSKDAEIARLCAELDRLKPSGQVAEDLNLLEAHDVYTCGHVRCAGGGCRITDSARRLAALAQEAEPLRAKVAEVEALKAGTEVAWREEMRRLREARAEVERLRVENASMGQRWMRAIGDRDALAVRLQVAESRLAAIRARAEDTQALLSRGLDGLLGVARWVLDGDAPNLPKILEGSGNPSTASNGSGEVPQEDNVPVLPGDFALTCSACKQVTPHRWKPSPEAGNFWRCSECGEPSSAKRYPCSSTCTHADAETPGHPERMKERSEAFREPCDHEDSTVYHRGAEAMRAACWEAVQEALEPGFPREGWQLLWDTLKAAVDGVKP